MTEYPNEWIAVGAVAVTTLILAMNFLWDDVSTRGTRLAVREGKVERAGRPRSSVRL